ncbi:long-chain fatty acid-CoA ligase [Coelomomyces lativittatus]|nr:long-chain fatty acid-CoA ligase [Coelomomyces lativittatus]
MDTLYEEGKTHPLAFTSPSTSDTALIMYTSGSTGPPKGVVLTHANLLSGVGGVETTLRPVLRDDDVYLAYLPLAHVLEFMVELVCLYAGIAVGYGHPKTLVDTNMRHCVSDLRALQPTMMAGVPAVWEAVRKGVLSKVTSRPWWVRAMFQGAMQWKAWCQTHRLPSWLYWVHDRVVFKKIRDQVGGRLRFALSGGAPISLDTQAFLSTALCPLYQGYGLTESGGICILFDPELPLQFQHIGPPVPCTELMLVPVDTYPHQPQVGELWIRGPNITSGYFKQPKLTADVFQSKTGWFQTGDIARHLPNGQFQIIDRVKNLVKVLNGEYVALEKLESFYSHCMYVQRLCLYADARANGIVAIVVPSPAPLLALATSLGMAANTDLDQLCEHPEVLHTIMKELQALGKKLKLASFEMVFGTILSPEDWTPQNQLLTAAMKLKRRDIYAKFKSQIEALYASVK